MANSTYIVARSFDNQKYQEDVRIRIKDATFDGTVLPLVTKVTTVLEAIFGTTVLSDNFLTDFWIEVHCDPTSDLPIGGTGNVATATYLKTRSAITEEDFVFSIPALNKANVIFDPTNPNSVSTSGPLFTALRAALVDAAIAWSPPDGPYRAVTNAESIQAASALQGKRAPKRVR